MVKKVIKTVSVRVRDNKHCGLLRQITIESHLTWNLAHELTCELSAIPVQSAEGIPGNTSVFELQKELITVRQEGNYLIQTTALQEMFASHRKSRKQY